MTLARAIAPKMKAAIERNKSILLFGPRQVGKTTLVKSFKHDIYITLMDPEILQTYESAPQALLQEVRALRQNLNRKPLIILDEIQKLPSITDSVQVLIDEGSAQFIMTGSSARKMRNLLPGRVIKYVLCPFSLEELEAEPLDLDRLLINGSLPEVFYTQNQADIDELINSYVSTYIEEEIRKEALVRNIGKFSNFLQLSAIESGNAINLTRIASDIGVSHQTISEYYKILQDCMLVEKIEALTQSSSRKRLSKAPKFITFDLGIKRIAAGESHCPSQREQAFLFEQFIGLELKRMISHKAPIAKLYYWRSHDGPEVDFVILHEGIHIPIEVKWTKTPSLKDARHLLTFSNEYKTAPKSYIICQCKSPRLIADNVLALPWQSLAQVLPIT